MRTKVTGSQAQEEMTSSHRTGLIAFGAVFVVLFAWIAVADGLGGPSVPSGDVAVVDDVPGNAGEISRASYAVAFRQAALRSGLKKNPKPGDNQFEAVRDGAMNDLLDQAWLTGEAAELGVTASDREIDNELTTIKESQFPSPEDFKAFLKESGFTNDQVRDRVRLQVLSRKIQEQISNETPKPTEAEIESFYEASEDQYTTPAQQEIRLIVTSDKKDTQAVEKALADDDSEKAFARLARTYSKNASKSSGGKTIATEGQFEDPAGSAIMGAAEGDVQGPIEVNGDTYFFRVTKSTPEEVQPLSRVRSQIEEQITPTLEQAALTSFVEDYNAKWTSRTVCDEGLISDSVQAWEKGLEGLAPLDQVQPPPQWLSRCSNFSGTGIPESVPWACVDSGAFSELKPEEEADLACPPPVSSSSPIGPGDNAKAGPLGELPNPQDPSTEPKPQGPTPPFGTPPPAPTGAPTGLPVG